MRDHTWQRAESVESAVQLVSADPDAAFLAGGSNLVDHLKLGISRPSTLVDITSLPLTEIESVEGGLRVGAMVRNSDLAADSVVRERFPVLARALLSGASGQIRHQASTGGNLLQRTRCVYFQDLTTPCNKREPGTGCSAQEGYGRYNAILGASTSCVATHPSDMAVAMSVLSPSVEISDHSGATSIDFTDLHRLPGHEPERDTTLAHGDLITSVTIPWLPDGARSTYVKVRDRASYAFALVSVATVLTVDAHGAVSDVRVAWGGVAHKPWRATLLEQQLRGVTLTAESIASAVDAELAAASTTDDTAYKVPMLRGATISALLELNEESAR